MMNLIEKYNLTPLKIVKIAGIAFAGLFVAIFLLSLLGGFLNTARSVGQGGVFPSMPPIGSVAYDYGKVFSEGAMMPEFDSVRLSTRNIMPLPSYGTTGNDAEQFEVSDYNANIETRNLTGTCATVSALKARSYVVFENATESDTNCYYRFKVAHANVEEVLTVLKALDPKDLTENTYTIKSQIEDFTSETEILEKKRVSIDQTLTNALNAYDDITELAVKTQNAEALAKIIDSKIQTITRLTQERLNINEQLDRLARAKAEQLDRLDYTYFGVSIYENKYFDGEGLKDSWKATLKNFVNSVNRSLQNATVGVLGFVFIVFPYLIYLFLLIFAAKYGWKLTQYIWEK